MRKIVILASGSGTNTANIVRYFNFNEKSNAIVNVVLSNNKNAKVLDKATKLKTGAFSFNKAAFNNGNVLQFLKAIEPDLIVLAGFLWKIPLEIIETFPQKIINIHPSLLPKYGGKGMYGMNVHEAVAANKETETGITIHYVNEAYDQGAIIFQSKTSISSVESALEIASKVHKLEQEHFPIIIEKILNEQI